METQPTPGIFERFNQWITESIMVKLFSIGFLILILLIPSSWIESLIRERQYRSDEVIREVSDKWSGPQILSGPVLRIPFTKKEKQKPGMKANRWRKLLRPIIMPIFYRKITR